MKKIIFKIECENCDGEATTNVLDLSQEYSGVVEIDVMSVEGEYECNNCGAVYYVNDPLIDTMQEGENQDDEDE